jgi:iron complex outermembrane receptor protein
MTPQTSFRRPLLNGTILASLALAGLAAAPDLAHAAAGGDDAWTSSTPVAASNASDAAAITPATGTAAASSADVVVTARRQTERAQDVPIALTALTRTVLEQTHAYTLADVQDLAPDLVAFETNPRNSGIGIRGIGVSSASDGLDTSVGVYIDGVYLGRPGMALEDLVDVDQVEVLDGPQGTLFGRNSAAGVVNITTQKPSFTPGAIIEGSYGNYDYNQIRFSLTGPLIGDVVAARLTAFDTHRDGVLPNTLYGTSDNSIGRAGGRLQFLITPTPKLTVRLIADYSTEDDTCCVSALKSTIAASTNAKDATLLHAFAALGYVPAAGDFTKINSPQDMLTDQHSVSAEFDYDLGWADLTSISAYRYWHFHPLQDSDGTPLDIIQVNVAQTKDDQYSQEFRLASKPGRFTWQAGVYLFNQDLTDHYILNQFGTQAQAFYTLLNGKAQNPPVTPGAQWIGDTSATSDSTAAFAQGNFKITDQLILTAGVRETYDTRHGITNAGGALDVGTPYIAGAIPFHYNVKIADTNTSYLVSLSYKVTRDVLAYVSYSTGYEAAGINLNSPPVAKPPPGVGFEPTVLNPEEVTDWEGGVKSTLFDQRVVLNLDLFSEYLTGLQVNTTPPNGKSYLANVGNIRSEGVEGEIDWSVIDGLTLSANASYDDAYYTSYRGAPGVTGEATAPVQNLSGRPVYQAPRWVVNATARYDWTWKDDIDPYVQAQYTYRSSVFGDVQDSPGALIPGYSLVNARIGARFDGGRYDASLWINNAFNAVYFNTLSVASISPGNGGQFGFSGLLGAPRTFGATIRAKF